MRIRLLRRAALLVLFLPVAARAAERDPSAGLARFDGVRLEMRGHTTRVHIRTSDPVVFRVQRLDAPVRLVVDLESTVFDWPAKRLDATPPPLRRIRGSQLTRDVSRVVLELTERAPYLVTNEPDGVRVDVAPGMPIAPAPVGAASGTGSVSLQLTDTSIVDVLRALGTENGKKLVIGDGVGGRASVALDSFPREQALDSVLDAHGLAKIDEGNALRITTRDALLRERTSPARVTIEAGAVDRRKAAAGDTAGARLTGDRAASRASAFAYTLVALVGLVVIAILSSRRRRFRESFGPLVPAPPGMTVIYARYEEPLLEAGRRVPDIGRLPAPYVVSHARVDARGRATLAIVPVVLTEQGGLTVWSAEAADDHTVTLGVTWPGDGLDDVDWGERAQDRHDRQRAVAAKIV